MPRAKKPSAFGNFVQEQLKESGGRTNMRDACKDPEYANAKWKNMSADEKAMYKAKLKTAKPNQKKMTNLGEDLKDVEREAMRKKQFADDMNVYINNKVNAASQEHRLKYMTFYIIHCNYFYKKIITGGADFFPAEICIIECNLEQGIKNTYVQHVRPDIDQGYSAEAQEHSTKTHQIPVDAQFQYKSFEEMYEEIRMFIMPGMEGDKLPPLFTRYRRGESLACESVISIMDQLAKAAGKPTDLIRIYSLEDLIASMCNASLETAGSPFEPALATKKLNKDAYQWKTGIQCSYHTTTFKCGMAYCSQSFVTRWFYAICDLCCKELKVKKRKGVHSPPESEVFFRESSLKASSIYDSKGATRSKSNTSSKNEKSQDADFVVVMHSRNHKNSSTERSVKSPQQIFSAFTTSSQSLQNNDANFPSLGNVPWRRNEISSAGNALENLTINDSKGATRSKSNTSSKKGNSQDADVIIVTHSSNHRNLSTERSVKSPQQIFNPFTTSSQSFQNNEESFPQLAKPTQHNSSIRKNNVKKQKRRLRK
ncbi:protein maelstrom homolog [Trichogramma pretiosum]|uniref:protein maelstrom homolog n=1 Tax=Trichogramma pretiosum TaxID=7493 RepID=UPI0006C9443A|nr:protein maelstrom homolog [Trichogramma pretiosum]